MSLAYRPLEQLVAIDTQNPLGREERGAQFPALVPF
jgi:hypothetical protein